MNVIMIEITSLRKYVRRTYVRATTVRYEWKYFDMDESMLFT